MKIFTCFFLCFSLMSFMNGDKTIYEKEKNTILTARKEFFLKYKSDTEEKIRIINNAGVYIQSSITDKITPYWYGTEWDFNGYTNVPNEGRIACGYFVSTVLLHAGLNINRYKMAQKHSFDEVSLYSCGEKVYDFGNIDKGGFISKIKNSLDTGLYILALDNHIGFLLIESSEVFFIHSNYRYPSKVVKELVEDSKALEDSGRFMLCSISGNKSLIEKWITNQRIGE